MRRWWIGVALTVGWLSAAATARAQGPMPEPLPTWTPASAAGPGGPMGPTGPMPSPAGQPTAPGEPLGTPTGPSGGPGMPCPVPVGGDDEQPGPADLSISANSPGAFMDSNPAPQSGCYAYAGFIALMRQKLGHGPVAYENPHFVHQPDTGNIPLRRNLIDALDWNQITPDMTFGPTATVGYLVGNQAVEVSGFYVPQHTDNATLLSAGSLFVPFKNAPIGFEGDNGLWRQADAVRLQLKSDVTSGEVNYRAWNSAFTGPELILGVRYFGSNEKASIITDDDILTVRDINLNPDPRREATYSVRAQNRLIGGQVGFEWNCVLHKCLTLNVLGKAALGPNLWQATYSLTRGDGFSPLHIRDHATLFSQLYEVGAFADVQLFERMKIRAGYGGFWFVNVAEAVDQVNYNLQTQGTTRDEHGSIFYHGPRFELQFLF